MRKYYKPRNVVRRSPNTKLPEKENPWNILRFYAESAVGILGWDRTCRVIGICQSRSTERYLALISDWENDIQMSSCALSASEFFAIRQVCALLKKYPFRSTETHCDPRKSAIEKWWAAEKQCATTNERLRKLTYDDTPRWVAKARLLIEGVLGPLTPELIMKIITSGTHGPGATLTSVGNRVTAYYKFADLPYSVTTLAKPYAYAAISSDPRWLDYLESTGRRKELPPTGSPQYQKELMILNDCVVVRESDRVTFVPKDCRTDRPIAVGASLNMFLQLGVKSYLEDSLKKHGVDLTSQAKNRQFAYLGSCCDDPYQSTQYSTIDLASASDTISIGIVELLLPRDWFAFLSDLRHETTIIEGREHTYEKFSAMGNGYTFPLESLIFWAVSKAAIEAEGLRCTNNDIAIYGDDIIVRYKAAPHVIHALNWAGFTVNEEKSFLTGSFKESCGDDYYRGHNVRPFYLKREVVTYADIYFISNWIAKKILSSPFTVGWTSAYKSIAKKVPLRHLSFGPMSSRRLAPRRYHDSLDIAEDFLEVPLSYMNSSGLRPWLSAYEKDSLIAAKLLSTEDSCTQSMLVCRSFPKAILYKCRPSVSYFMQLRRMHTRESYDTLDVLTLSGNANYTSRRNAVKYVTKVIPVLSWDSYYSFHELYKHPIW